MWRRRTAFAALAALVVVGAAAPASAARPTIDRAVAVLQGLDKITAKVSRLQVPVGDSVAFGTLEITVRACRSTGPDETPENAAFVEISDEPPGEDQHGVFSGWMFSSSPAVSALDHPVFDIWVVRCADRITGEPEDFGQVSRYRLPYAPPPPGRIPAALGR